MSSDLAPLRRPWLTLALVGLLAAGCGRPPGRLAPRSPSAGTTQEIQAEAGAVREPAPDMRLSADDWPMWRGPNQDGVAAGNVPTTWSATQNVVWKAPIPGRGHSSPIVVGDRIYFETADDQRKIQSVVCLNRADGSLAWQTEVHQGKFEQAVHHENTHASSTLACDGSRVYALFLNDRKIWATALDLDGNLVWQKEVGNFASRFGYAASPALFQDFILAAADHSSGGFVAALHRATGDIVWRKRRDAIDSYASPRVIDLGDKPQLILGGTNKVVSYDPQTGEQFWSVNGTAGAVVGTAVAASGVIVVSGGYPEAQTLALSPDGTVLWKDNDKTYVPSLLAYEGHVYLVNDDGVAICWEASTGKEKWKHRIGGNFRVSPLLIGGNIYVTDMSAKTTVFRASPERFDAVAENQLGTEAFATPAVSRNQLLLRVADTSEGRRQEYLYCIGDSSAKVSSRGAESEMR
jgi:outer membrane protein assembly factor BamB